MDVNSKQISGTHYVAPIQHWDFVIQNGLDYLRGNASKYITRARKKNGRADWLKAQHYIEKLMSGGCAHVLASWPQMGGPSLDDYVAANELSPTEHQMLLILCCRPPQAQRSVQLEWMQTVHDLITVELSNYPIHWLEGDTVVAGQHVLDDPADAAHTEPRGYGYVDQDG